MRRDRVSLAAFVLIAAAIFAWCAPAMAGETERNEAASDQSRADWFQSLKQPGGEPGKEITCCDVSDCQRTVAHQLADGSWTATVNGVEDVPIPDNKIVRDKTSIDGEAYVCNSMTGLIYCFVRPTPGF